MENALHYVRMQYTRAKDENRQQWKILPPIVHVKKNKNTIMTMANKRDPSPSPTSHCFELFCAESHSYACRGIRRGHGNLRRRGRDHALSRVGGGEVPARERADAAEDHLIGGERRGETGESAETAAMEGGCAVQAGGGVVCVGVWLCA